MKEEDKLVSALDEASFYEQIQPYIKAAMQAGGSAETILRKSQALAALRLVQLLNSEKDDVRLKAAEKLLDRSLGRPVERKVSIYADLETLSPSEIDRRLKSLLKKHEPAEILDAVIETKAVALVDSPKKEE